MSNDKLDAIFSKYSSYRIPEHVTKLMAQVAAPVAKMLSEFANLKRKAEHLDSQQSEELAKYIGEAQGLMGWTSVMLGIEFSDDIKRDSNIDSSTTVQQSSHLNSEDVTLKLSMEEWGVLDSCIEASKQLILKKTKLAKVPLNRQESDVVNRIEDLQEIIKEAGRETFMSLPNTKVHSTTEQLSAFNQLLISTYAGVDDAVLHWQIKQWETK